MDERLDQLPESERLSNVPPQAFCACGKPATVCVIERRLCVECYEDYVEGRECSIVRSQSAAVADGKLET